MPLLTRDFELQTDAGALGFGAVLERQGHVMAHASRSLTPEGNLPLVLHAYRTGSNASTSFRPFAVYQCFNPYATLNLLILPSTFIT